jgi:hypothetical protein
VRLYYQDPEIRITSSAFSALGQTYLLRDMKHAWRVRRRTVGPRAITAALVLLIVLVVEIIVIVVSSWMAAGKGLLIAGGVIFLARSVARLIGGAISLNKIEDIRRYRRRLELWAAMSSGQVLLLDTDDSIKHGQVCRALKRALDDRDARAVR